MIVCEICVGFVFWWIWIVLVRFFWNVMVGNVLMFLRCGGILFCGVVIGCCVISVVVVRLVVMISVGFRILFKIWFVCWVIVCDYRYRFCLVFLCWWWLGYIGWVRIGVGWLLILWCWYVGLLLCWYCCWVNWRNWNRCWFV